MQNALKVATGTDTKALDEVERGAALEGEARAELERILRWNREDAKDLALHEVERGLFKRLLQLG